MLLRGALSHRFLQWGHLSQHLLRGVLSHRLLQWGHLSQHLLRGVLTHQFPQWQQPQHLPHLHLWFQLVRPWQQDM